MKLFKTICQLSVIFFITSQADAYQSVVKVLTLETAITPVSAEYLIKAIHQAEEENAECLVIQLDTPGGLMTSMEDIIKAILGANIPVIVYVAPSGAKAASAGVFITMSSHIAAMAPATNIGAAHPVSLGAAMDSTMTEKVTNDAVAYIRSIAEKRGKNADWAEKAVV
ncbi:nodulation protein NfeD, partial [candidate division KSB1 bacterium]|nr:nodulation protein NfeD [candidate division KSB1 bacterium]